MYKRNGVFASTASFVISLCSRGPLINREFAAGVSLSDNSERVFEVSGGAGVKGGGECRGSLCGNRGKSADIASGMSSGKFCLLFINNSRFFKIRE